MLKRYVYLVRVLNVYFHISYACEILKLQIRVFFIEVISFCNYKQRLYLITVFILC